MFYSGPVFVVIPVDICYKWCDGPERRFLGNPNKTLATYHSPGNLFITMMMVILQRTPLKKKSSWVKANVVIGVDQLIVMGSLNDGK